MKHQGIIEQCEIKVRPIYICNKCGVPRGGSGTYTECTYPADLCKHPASLMPIGWSSHYTPTKNIFLCDNCQE